MSLRTSLNKLICRDPAATLRERADDLAADLARVTGKPADAKPQDETPATIEEAAQLDFTAYDLDAPVKTPRQWAGEFAGHAMGMHLADRTLRMSKPEMMAFVRDAGERDAEMPAIMLQALDSAQKTFAGWGSLLDVASSRYLVAASTSAVGGAEQNQTEGAETPDAVQEQAAPPQPSRADQVALAGLTGDVLAASGIDHRDGTVSYADAMGRVTRRPMASWINFSAQQMHSRVQGEMGRRRILEAGDLSAEEYADWEARIRRELRSDAIHALTFQNDRAFKAAQALRSGAEPATQELREQGDAELLALTPEWEAARDAYAQAIQQQDTITEAAKADGRPGPAPASSGPDWEAWFERAQAWRERTGVETAEEASGEACRTLGEIEDRIAELPAASLAGLRLKARVAQRCDDIELEWPDRLGEGLTRDLLAFTASAAVDWHAPPPGFMASPGLEPSNFVPVADGIARELARLRGAAWAEFHRRVGPETKPEDIGRIRRELHLDALSPRQPKSDILGQVDFTAADIDELRALHDRARELSSVAYAMSAMGCCEDNAAGRLLHWLADELTTVEGKAFAEMRGRQPSGFWDQRTRLGVVAESIIENGDDVETARFIQELTTWAAEQAQDQRRP